MHATRARLPQKRTRKPAAAKKPTAKKAASKAAASALAPALPEGVASLAAHRSRRALQIQPVEVFALVEWIAPARESWRRGELEVRRSACMPMTATRQADDTLALTDLPGQGDALVLEKAAIAELQAGTTLIRALPGLRVTLSAEELAPALPPAPQAAVILAFPKR
jgi:hypothetical protein